MIHSDISLFLEGTYPYVRGGVSSWVHQLIQGMPDKTFYLVFVGGDRSFYGEPYFELPSNVVGMEVHYIMESATRIKPRVRSVDNKKIAEWCDILIHFQNPEKSLSKSNIKYFLETLGKDKGFSIEDFLHSKESWDVLTELYSNQLEQQSFVDYFWTFRNVYKPLFKLAKIAREVPTTGMVHSISTGFAGFLAALVKQQQQVPYLLSEHGIYTKERKIDLAQATWIKSHHNILDNSIHKTVEQTRKMWITFFEQLGKTAYDYADQITALYAGNQKRQIKDGAPIEKTQIIVNGIQLERFTESLKKRPETPPKVAGLIGRVVPIKDIKTFIRSITIAVEKDAELEGWIIGPAEEDKEYNLECEMLVKSLNMENHIKFLGMQNVAEIIPQMGVCVLTSISEAQPLVLLEAMACGIPCVATDVGACSEIIYGMNEKDAELGNCGYIADIASPSQIATAISNCLQSPEHWKKLGDCGLARVTEEYQERDLFDRYDTLYNELLNWQE